ncbi:MAG: SRPBCC family protein, partial [Deltaproteobacteria bacterium]|nr:SRPBCC family protein [Deltaproteobacteria bacterium]
MCSRTNRLFISTIVALTLALGITTGLRPASAGKAAGGFSKEEVRAITPLLRRHGMVGLAESKPDGEPKAMTLAVRVKAPREQVFKVFENPENFYYLSTLFKENEVLQEHDNNKAWSWASRHKLFSFTGTNTIALFPPRRADVKIVDSTIGNGEFTFTLYPNGPDHTIVVLQGLLDVQTSEWLIRYLLGGNPSMRQAMNVAIGIVVVKGVKAMAERMASGKGLDKHRTRGKAGGTPRIIKVKELEALAPLLVRGQVLITDSYRGGRLRQATVIEVFDTPAKDILGAISTPQNYPKMIKAIDEVTVHDASDPKMIDFSWSFGFSVFSLGSRNKMTEVEGGVLVEALKGDLAGAAWRWQIVPTAENR